MASDGIAPTPSASIWWVWNETQNGPLKILYFYNLCFRPVTMLSPLHVISTASFSVSSLVTIHQVLYGWRWVLIYHKFPPKKISVSWNKCINNLHPHKSKISREKGRNIKRGNERRQAWDGRGQPKATWLQKLLPVIIQDVPLLNLRGSAV